MNEEKNIECKCKKKGNGLTVVLALAALAAGTGIGYIGNNIINKDNKPKTEEKTDKVESTNTESNTTTSNSNSNSNVTNNTTTSNTTSNQTSNVANNSNSTQTKVVNLIEEKNGIPYININGLNSINKEIEKNFNEAKNNKGSSEYFSMTINNILILRTEHNYPSAMDAMLWSKIYYIDLTTNKQINVNQVVKKMGITEKELINKLKEEGYSEDNKIPNDLMLIPLGKGNSYVVMCPGLGCESFTSWD